MVAVPNGRLIDRPQERGLRTYEPVGKVGFKLAIILANQREIAMKPLGMFHAMPAHFSYNGVFHISSPTSSSGDNFPTFDAALIASFSGRRHDGPCSAASRHAGGC